MITHYDEIADRDQSGAVVILARDARPAFLATKLKTARATHPGAYVIPCRACAGQAVA